ncbi:MAG: UDP-3-O-(3-hydroxymyristoyl)glucosamine N-acyltransferase [Acidobacteria bacterium]|nr:UDP-3-O-(3-hydroxymyristoyl)glucosamine N-acyltransferase [Acidobacteriota bacterium]
MPITVSELAGLLGLCFQGTGSRELRRISSWEAADDHSLVFYDRVGKGPIRDDQLRAGCVIAPRDLVPPGATAIHSHAPKLDFARAAAFLAPAPRGTGWRHTSAVVSSAAEIDADVDLGPCCVVGAGAVIGRGSILHAGVVVGEGCSIGADCILHPRVILYPGTTLGDRVVLHAGAVIGGDGFGYVFDGQAQVKFPQAGSVVIEDDVEIGCNTTVDRGSLGVTRICAGAKIDNLVQIAHNVQVGRSVVIAAQTGISGSTVIEDYAVIGGQVGFGDHARVERGAVIGSKAGVLPGKIVRGGETYWGVPVRPLSEYKRLNALFGRLPEMKSDIDSLKKAVEEIRAGKLP